jgi:hypothetical protein
MADNAGAGVACRAAGNRLMLPVMHFAYDRFADILFAWNKRKG